MSRNDLEDRLSRFVETVAQLAEQLPNTKTGIQLQGRIIKSSSAASLHYGEAQSAGSRKHFIRKLKIVLKHLRETNAGLITIDDTQFPPDLVFPAVKEVNELIAIFITSIRTATQNEAIAKRYKKSNRLN